MKLKLNNNSFLTISITKKYKKNILKTKIESKYFNYELLSKIRYEEIISFIEDIESMIFSKNRYADYIELNKIVFDFDEFETKITVLISISENESYTIRLNRKNVIELYNYLTEYTKTLNKIRMINFEKKYTFVQVKYIDAFCAKRYTYISNNKKIKVGDIVYVDRAGKKCLAVVESKGEYYYEDAPYPIFETKRVIKIVTKAKNYIK